MISATKPVWLLSRSERPGRLILPSNTSILTPSCHLTDRHCSVARLIPPEAAAVPPCHSPLTSGGQLSADGLVRLPGQCCTVIQFKIPVAQGQRVKGCTKPVYKHAWISQRTTEVLLRLFGSITVVLDPHCELSLNQTLRQDW